MPAPLKSKASDDKAKTVEKKAKLNQKDMPETKNAHKEHKPVINLSVYPYRFRFWRESDPSPTGCLAIFCLLYMLYIY